MADNQDLEPKIKLSEEEIAAIAKQVTKNLKAKHLSGIGASLGKNLKAEQLLAVGKGLAKSWVILGIILLGMGLAIFVVYKNIPSIFKDKAKKAFDAEITNQIKLQFTEPQFSNVVVSVASSEASNILQNQVAPEIAKFQSALNDALDDFPTNLYSRMTFEWFASEDTNRVVRYRSETNVVTNWYVYLKLQYVPVDGSIQGTFTGDLFPVNIEPLPRRVKNVMTLGPFNVRWPMDETKFLIRYVRNTRDTNMIKKMEIRGDYLLTDGVTNRLKWADY